MSSLRTSLVALGLVVGASLLVQQHTTGATLRREISIDRALRDDLVRRQAKGPVLPDSIKGTATPITADALSNAFRRNEAPPVSSVYAAKVDSVQGIPSPWKNAGRATPAATIETAMWAAAQGDVETLSQLITVDADARAAAATLFATLPEKYRTEYRTPERLSALMLAHDAPLGGIEILDQTEPVIGRALLHLRMARPDGTTKEMDLALANSSGGWRIAITPNLIERFRKKLSAPHPGASVH